MTTAEMLELDRLREEVAQWRARFDAAKKRNGYFANSGDVVDPVYTALDIAGDAAALELPG